MAIKKSELYSSLWAGCDELRGGMDASQYKDYVLVLLFVKYVSDKYADDPDALIEIPEGGSFKDMVAAKGQKDIGDQLNKIIGKLAETNDLKGVIDVADFNDDDKMGKGKEMVDRLTKLVAIFQNPKLNFSKNRADGDDILGDAYEYLMKNFATESGKSKGQFYTPAEVSRIMAKVIGIKDITASGKSIYDPTCGSGSLLLKAVDETDLNVTIYGQEKDVATAALARMNMILHANESAEITKGQSTLSDPLFKNELGYLKTFDFSVANPPFSSKNWMNGFDPANDLYERFKGYGTPPAKNGDFAFLLHIVKSLKSKGKGACILPHGVLFRGNAEAEIRENLISKGYIKGIIGLPANLFFGTGIPACIIVIDKENADARKGIFMVDASKGFLKDGNKNRLREQDIHKIVDVFNKQLPLPKYSRMVPVSEISDEKNAYNLNIPRYIDSQEIEDIQDIEAHLLGGIPNADIDALQKYWDVYPSLKTELFADNERANYSDLKVAKDEIKTSIFDHPEFVSFSTEMDALFEAWKTTNTKLLKELEAGFKPKQTIFKVSEDLLQTYTNKKLIDKYDVYQHLMNYWNDTMQDDCYAIAADAWVAELYIVKQTKKETQWDCDLVPKTLVIDRYFQPEKQAIEKLEAEKENIGAQMEEMAEEHSGDEGILELLKNEKGKITKGNLQERVLKIKDEILEAHPTKAMVKAAKAIKKDFTKVMWEKGVDDDNFKELDVLYDFLLLFDNEKAATDKIKKAITELDTKVIERYKTLTEDEIKQLVVDDKWIASIEKAIKTEMERISQALTSRIKELAERYEITLPKQTEAVADIEAKVAIHLQKNGIRMELKEGYKNTELGVIPDDWDVKLLGSIGTFSKGQGVRKDESLSGELPCIRYGEIYTKHNDYIKNFYSFISKDVAQTARKISKGDILFAGSGETKEDIGKSIAFIDSFEAFAGGDIVILSPREIDSLFLGFLLNAPIIQKQKASKGQGDAVVHISATQLANIKIPLPKNKSEQTAIATALSDTDALITSIEKLIAKKRLIKQGVMQKLLTPKEGWEVKTLGEVSKFRRGSFPQPYGLDKWYDDIKGYPFVQVFDVDKNNKIKPDTKRHISKEAQPFSVFTKKGTIILTIQGSIGRIAITQYDAYIDRTLLIFEEMKVPFNNYFFMLLVHDIFEKEKQAAPGGIIKTITKAALSSFEIKYPQSIEEQTRIATILSDMEDEIETLETKLAKYKQIKQGMMQNLLTGKIRLVKPKSNELEENINMAAEPNSDYKSHGNG